MVFKVILCSYLTNRICGLLYCFRNELEQTRQQDKRNAFYVSWEDTGLSAYLKPIVFLLHLCACVRPSLHCNGTKARIQGPFIAFAAQKRALDAYSLNSRFLFCHTRHTIHR